jgi:hypothetical protein
MNKRQIIKDIVIAVTLSSLAAFILNLLFKIHTNGLFAAEWSAGDALNYIAGISTACGTIILGYVSYKQNDRLQKLEDNNYIANNSSMMLMNEIKINQKAHVPVNWDEHPEQIIVDSDKCENGNYGYKFTFSASCIGGSIPTLVHIKECNIFCSNEDNTVQNIILFGRNYSKNIYSRVAIHNDNCVKFGMTYVIDSKKRITFEDTIKQDSYRVTIEIIFDIITDKNVITKCKCRSYCSGTCLSNDIVWKDDEPMVFFYGHDIANTNDIKISGSVNESD